MKKSTKKITLFSIGVVMLLLVAIFATMNPFKKMTVKADNVNGPDLSMFTFLKNSDSEGYYYSVRLKNKALKNVTIPETYLELPVKEIAINGFSNSNLESIHIPDSITKIGSNAFNGSNSLRYVSMQNVKAIGTTAFANCDKLKDVVIPAATETVEASAFKFSEPKVHVVKSEEETKSWDNWLADFDGTVVYGVKTLIGTLTEDKSGYIIIQSTIDAPTVSLFLDYYNEDLNYRADPYDENRQLLKDSKPIKAIAVNAFSNTKLDHVAIGRYSDHDIKIESGAFLDAQINSVWIGSNVRFVTTTNNVEEAATSVFAGSSIKRIDLPTSLTVIPDAMFQYCESLQSVTFHGGKPNFLSDSLSAIGEEAFLYCTSMPSIYIPQSVVTIGANAFSGWENDTITVWFSENQAVPPGWHELWYDGLFKYSDSIIDNIIVYYLEIGDSAYIIGREPYEPGTIHQLKNLTKDQGYATFSGWYMHPDLIGTGETGTALNIYPTASGEIWLAGRATLVNYSIKFYINGDLVQSSTYTILNSITLLRPPILLFDGWYTNSSCTGQKASNYIPAGSTGNRSYYATAYNNDDDIGINVPPSRPVIPPYDPNKPIITPIPPPGNGTNPPIVFPPVIMSMTIPVAACNVITLKWIFVTSENE